MHLRCLSASFALALCASVPAHAQTQFIAQAGAGDHVTSLTLGAAWPLAWKATRFAGEWTVSAELLANYWRARQASGERTGFVNLAAVPVLRYRLDEGRSPWFLDAGIGLSLTNRIYTRDTKTFSTRFNFYDTVGAGVNFGASREHELAVRLIHVSNGGYKHPNPGENFLQLRYARRF